MFFLNHIWIIPLFPAFGAACMFFFGRKLSKSAVNGVCVGVIVLAFAWACLAVWQYTGYSAANPGKPFETILFTWLGTGTTSLAYPMHGGAAQFNADAGFLLDPLSSIWLLFVTGVGMLIHIYSMGYMAHEGGYYRFFGYLNLFMFSMLTLILANNYAVMFVGLGGRGPVLVPADRLLLPATLGIDRRQQGIHRQPHRRRRISAGHVDHRLVLRLGAVHRDQSSGAQRALPNRRSGDYRCLPAAVRRSLRQVGAISAVRLAARCDGRSDAGLRLDPCGDDGHRRRLHGGALQRAVRAGALRR